MVLREWLEKMAICLETWPGIADDLHYHEFDDIVALRMIRESSLNVVHGAAHLEVNASHFDDGDAVEEDIAVDAKVVFGSS